jgi:hypothetical protein
MAVSRKYGKVTFERGTIEEAEPVFVVRARDLAGPSVVRQYKWLCEALKSPDSHLYDLDALRTEMWAWQAKHARKIPGLPLVGEGESA